MSITSRINEMSSHIEQAYDELQGLGADLTNVNKNIENISMVLDDIYDDLPKVTGSGTSITLDDTRKGRLESTLSGNTSQTTYSGYNLMNFNVSQNSRVTVNNDGTITINGAGGFGINYEQITLEANKTYKQGIEVISGSLTSGNINTAFMSFNATGGIWLTTSGKVSYTPTENISKSAVWVNADANCNNLKIRIWGYKGTDDKNFEPYVGKSISPNPSYPQPVNVVSGDNEINVCGKNLLKLKNGSNVSQGVTITINDNKATFVGTPTRAYVGSVDMPLNLKKGTYTLSSTNGVNSFFLWFKNQSGNVFSSVAIRPNPSTITLNEDTYSIQVGLEGLTVGTACNVETYFQLEKGSTATSYEPYNGDAYNIDLPVENLWNTSKLQSGYLNQSGSYPTTNPSYPNARYRLVHLYKGQSITTYKSTSYGDFRMRYIDVDTNLIVGTVGAGDNGGYCSSNITYQGGFNNGTITALKDVILGLLDYGGNLAEATITYGTKIQAISPTPIELCKIGNYQDYIYKDSDKWYLHKEIGKVVLNGSENWIYDSSHTRFLSTIYSTATMLRGQGFCDHYKYGDSVNSGCFDINIDKKTIYMFAPDNSITTSNTFKAWLGTNLPIVYYSLATPTNTEITYQPLIDQLNLLEKAMSKDGQTNISQVNNDLPFIISASALKEWQESSSLNSTLSMVNPLSLGNTLNTQENNTQPIEVDNIEPLEEEENEES